MKKQKTIKKNIQIKGIGLHTGCQTEIILKPADADTGIQFFLRDDIGKEVIIPAHADYVSQTQRCTVLGKGDVKVWTVEHLLSATHALEVDNLIVEVKGREIPALDGSALPFVESLLKAGIKEQKSFKKYLVINKPVFVQKDSSYFVAMPGSEELKIICCVYFDHPHIGAQMKEVTLSEDYYIRELAPARTFGFLEEVQRLLRDNLALGGNLENALIISPKGYLSQLRFTDEVVRHKCLDLVGDLALCGKKICGQIIAIKTSHSLNVMAIKEILKQEV